MTSSNGSGSGNRGRLRASKVLLLVASSLIALLGAEITLRVAGWGGIETRMDPFEGFEGTGPFFVEDPRDETRRIPAPNRPYFDQSFQMARPESTSRIIALGGSTTAGVPFGRDRSFPASLQRYLDPAVQGHQVEVINAGISGRGSSRVLEVLKEMLHYDPSLVVVYTGQNEWRDARYHARQMTLPASTRAVLSAAMRSRALFFIFNRIQLLRDRLGWSASKSRAIDAIRLVTASPFSESSFPAFNRYRVPDLLQDGTSSTEHPDTDELESKEAGTFGRTHLTDPEILARFEHNIEAMIDLCHHNGVPILFLSKASNPQAIDRTVPPTVSSRILRPGTHTLWRSHYERLVAEMRVGNSERALAQVDSIRNCYRTSHRFEDDRLDLLEGECLERRGRHDLAANRYSRRLGWRHEQINARVREQCNKRSVPVVDVQELLGRNSELGIVGYGNYFFDRMHMSEDAYRLIGCAAAGRILELGLLAGGESSRSKTPECRTGTPRLPDSGQVPLRSRSQLALAWSEFQQGRGESALDRGHRALRLGLEEGALDAVAQSHLLLGHAYTDMGDLDAAREEHRHLVRIWADRAR